MNRTFTFNWKVSLFALCCLLLFIKLGFWQLEREEEKRTLIAGQEEKSRQLPLPAASLPSDASAGGLPTLLHGSFDERAVYLLDNRVLDGRVGFEVLQLFNEDDGSHLLVNRGFLPMGRTRQDLPDIPSVTVPAGGIRGVVHVPSGEAFQLETVEVSKADFPVIVQQADVAAISGVLGMTLYPYVVRLAEGEPGALPRYWPDTVMQPAQHRGYAIQWFTMALAVALAWLAFSFRRREAGPGAAGADRY